MKNFIAVIGVTWLLMVAGCEPQNKVGKSPNRSTSDNRQNNRAVIVPEKKKTEHVSHVKPTAVTTSDKPTKKEIAIHQSLKKLEPAATHRTESLGEVRKQLKALIKNAINLQKGLLKIKLDDGSQE